MRDSGWQHGISRRSLLRGLGSLAIAQGLGGCRAQPASVLRVELLRGSVPPQLIKEFGRQTANQTIQVKTDAQAQLQDLFSLLQSLEQTPTAELQQNAWWDWIPLIGDPTRGVLPDWVTLGDYWLQTAIAQKLITPIDPKALTAWGEIAKRPALATLVTRDADGFPAPTGQVYGLPYRVGSMVMIYRRDLLEQQQIAPPKDWADLWRPEFKHRIALLDQARTVIGLTLKKLGRSLNTADLATVPNLEAELLALQHQTKLYSGASYLQPLVLGDVWVAVGWSTDGLPLAQRDRKLAIATPTAGTALWADVWVHPAKASQPLSPAASRWADFYWQPDIAKQLSTVTWAVSPVLLGTPRDQLPATFRDHPALLPDPAILQASEFLLPLPPTAIAQYQQLWEKVRRTPPAA